MSWYKRRIMVSACVILGAVAASAGLPASVPFRGLVHDAGSGRPLPGVLINVLDRDDEVFHDTSTDSTGAYELDPGTRATVIYSLPGYETLRIKYPDDLRTPGECGCKLKNVTLRLLI